VQKSVRFVCMPPPFGIRSHSPRLKAISLLSFSIMKFSVLLCQAATVSLLSSRHAAGCQLLCVQAAHPSLGAFPTHPMVPLSSRFWSRNLQGHLRRRKRGLFPHSSLKWTHGVSGQCRIAFCWVKSALSEYKFSPESPNCSWGHKEVKERSRGAGVLSEPPFFFVVVFCLLFVCFLFFVLFCFVLNIQKKMRDPWSTVPENCSCNCMQLHSYWFHLDDPYWRRNYVVTCYPLPNLPRPVCSSHYYETCQHQRCVSCRPSHWWAASISPCLNWYTWRLAGFFQCSIL